MSRDASVTLPWADGDHTFRLPWAQLIQLQEACGAGPYAVLARLSGRDWRVEDISTTIRLGLIGGGKTPDQALALVRDYVESRPPLENVALARGVLTVALVGAPDGEKPGEASAAPTVVTE